MSKYTIHIGPPSKQEPDLRVTHRFADAYYGMGIGYQGRVEGEVHDFVRRYRADPKLALHSFDQVAHLKPDVIFELEVTAGDRLLTIWRDGTLILAELGPHETTARYTRAKYRADSVQNYRAPDRFWPDVAAPRLFSDRTDEPLSIYHTEMSRDWIYWLSRQQSEAMRAIVNDWGSRNPDNHLVHFIVGGPGTGKTSILLRLLKDFTELECDVRIIRASLKTLDIDRYRGYVDTAAAEILLIDDPASFGQLSWPLRGLTRQAKTRLLVLAFDPSQLLDSLSDSTYDRLVSE